MKFNGPVYPIVLGSFQILLLALFAGFVDYRIPEADRNKSFYPQFQDVHVMIFFGIGLLMTFLSKYGYASCSYNLLLGSVTVQWATLVNAWMRQRVLKNLGHYDEPVEKVEVGLMEMMAGDFAAATVLISFGVVLGKASRLQMLVMAIMEVVVYAINETVIMEYLKVADIGGSILVHLFAAYFGMAVSLVLRNYNDPHEKEGSNYHSDLFSMVGTLFLWCYWPSFNSALLGFEPARQSRAIVNTYMSMASCVVTSFVVSSLISKDFKLNMVHIQNSTLAGGVAVGTTADLMIKPWGAVLSGMLVAVISVLGYSFLTPFLNRKGLHDTCGVHNLHGMPGFFSAIVGAIATVAVSSDKYPGTDFNTIYGAGRSLQSQAGYQFAAAVVSFTFAVGGGLITGIVIKNIDPLGDQDHFDDKKEFIQPPGYMDVSHADKNGNELKSVERAL